MHAHIYITAQIQLTTVLKLARSFPQRVMTLTFDHNIYNRR